MTDSVADSGGRPPLRLRTSMQSASVSGTPEASPLTTRAPRAPFLDMRARRRLMGTSSHSSSDLDGMPDLNMGSSAADVFGMPSIPAISEEPSSSAADSPIKPRRLVRSRSLPDVLDPDVIMGTASSSARRGRTKRHRRRKTAVVVTEELMEPLARPPGAHVRSPINASMLPLDDASPAEKASRAPPPPDASPAGPSASSSAGGDASASRLNARPSRVRMASTASAMHSNSCEACITERLSRPRRAMAALDPTRLFSRRFERTPGQDPFRTLYVNRDRHHNEKFSNNSVSTTKYSLGTFVPRFFFEQFGKASNFFFLFCACVAMVPQTAVLNPIIALTPLLVTLLLSGIKEVIEDTRRYNADQRTNNTPVLILREGSFQQCSWKDVVVGDILLVKEGDAFCADLILVSTSEPHGVCFVETSSIDGESNLKIRKCIKESRHVKDPGDLSRIQGTVVCEGPNNRLYTFDGLMNITQGLEHRRRHDLPAGTDDFEIIKADVDVQAEAKRVSLTPNELVLRGSTLQNTRWIHGLVIYTGHETKLFRNSDPAPIKLSNLQQMLNRQIIFLFFGILCLAAILVVADVVMQSSEKDYWYTVVSSSSDWFVQFLRGILLLQNIIPIGLFFQLEIVRFLQGLYINWDAEMYHDERGIFANARTTNLNEQLGQVQHIFSDKTGTLTQNKMVFQRAVVGGVLYGGPIESDSAFKKHPHFEAETMVADLKSAAGEAQRTVLFDFCLNLALCQTVIPEEDEQGELKYRASSPDELALLLMAKQVGFVFSRRTPETVTVTIFGEPRTYEILQLNDFNSTRKRMSVIVRRPDGRIFLYCKGADNMIFERLGRQHEDAHVLHETNRALAAYSRLGLRTLCFSKRELTREQHVQWAKVYKEASEAMYDRGAKLEAAAEEIERDMELLGATAIEDKLQDGVPETISMLLRAGIKMWVLTGDKQETAINIGMSSRLMDDRTDMRICNGDEEWLINFLEDQLQQFEVQEQSRTLPRDMALVIDGATLFHALHDDIKDGFIRYALYFKTVICCRVSPLQKATVVQLVKEYTGAITMAIGDGANDVGMIQAAGIGVGIHGEEGGQAVRASDYSIGQFRYLQRLLLLHGSWSYFRQSSLILYQFYIQIVFNMVLMYYQGANMYGIQVLYQPFLHVLYFTAFTGLPVMFPAVLDRHISERKAFQVPEAYNKNNMFNPRLFWFRAFVAMCHTAIIFGFVTRAMHPDCASFWVMGSIVYTCVMTTITIALWISIIRITAYDTPIMILSLAAFVIAQYSVSTTIFTNDIDLASYYHVFQDVAEMPQTWFLIVLAPVTVFVSILTLKFLQQQMFPFDFQILNEIDWIEERYQRLSMRGLVHTMSAAVREVFMRVQAYATWTTEPRASPSTTSELGVASSGVMTPEMPAIMIPLNDLEAPAASSSLAAVPARVRKGKEPSVTQPLRSSFAFSTPDAFAGVPQSVLIRLYGTRKRRKSLARSQGTPPPAGSSTGSTALTNFRQFGGRALAVLTRTTRSSMSTPPPGGTQMSGTQMSDEGEGQRASSLELPVAMRTPTSTRYAPDSPMRMDDLSDDDEMVIVRL